MTNRRSASSPATTWNTRASASSSPADGQAALTAVRQRRPDLVVLDLGLPGLDGLDVTRELRRDSTIPIVMLTARDDELDKVVGLELGADDYLTKPFSPRELVARVRAVLRRTEAGPAAKRPGPCRRRRPGRAPDAGRGGRPRRRTDRYRIRPAAHARRQPGPDLHPLPAPRRDPRGRLRVLRARDRLAHQEPAPEARAGSTGAALRPDRLRRGLSIRRRPWGGTA